MNDQPLAKQRLPFAAERDSREFMRELVRHLSREVDARQRKLVSLENEQIFYHGKEWIIQRQEPEGYAPHSGSLELQTIECTIRNDRLLSNDVTAVSDFLREMADKHEEQFKARMFGEMKATAEESGTTLSLQKDVAIGDALIDLIRRTDLLVGADGRISRPSLFLQPGMRQKIEDDLAQRGPEFKERIETLWKEKEKQALAREAERLAQYDRIE